MVAYRLVDLMGRASAAYILGITARELDTLVEVFDISEKFTKRRDPSAAITWARELKEIQDVYGRTVSFDALPDHDRGLCHVQKRTIPFFLSACYRILSR